MRNTRITDGAKLFCTLGILALVASPFFAFAQTTSASDLQSSINAKNAEIQALQNQINQYQNQIEQTASQAQSLQGTLKVINQSQKNLKQNLNLTTKKIQGTALTLTQNQHQINQIGQGINADTSALSETLRSLNENDDQTFFGFLISNQTVSGFLRDVDDIDQIQSTLKHHVSSLQVNKSNLEQSQATLAAQKQQLLQLQNQLADQKQIVDSEAAQKSQLLAQTKDQQSQYQAQLDATKKQIDQLNTEIYNYESSLKFTLNPNTLPAEGSAPLSWPLDNVLITQKFGKTVDSKRLYAVGTHSGVDFRAAVGTPVYAAADGTVEGTGNTDTTCPKASFGKWVYIVHTNGLATVYGHLSLIKATPGQVVKQGDLIAYSGATGHATAPHLHVTVFAANGINGQQGSRVAQMPSAACKGKDYTMPLAPVNAYLDPLLYFPQATAAQFKDRSGEDSTE